MAEKWPAPSELTGALSMLSEEGERLTEKCDDNLPGRSPPGRMGVILEGQS